MKNFTDREVLYRGRPLCLRANRRGSNPSDLWRKILNGRSPNECEQFMHLGTFPN